jgi:hypothetical protein
MSAHPNISEDGAYSHIRVVQEMLNVERAKGLAALDELFRSGRPPDVPLHGRYHGRLLTLDLAPGLTPLLSTLAARWMPWQGKHFDAGAALGDNVFTSDSRVLAHIYWPLYRGYRVDRPGTYRAFAFRTTVAPGLMHPTLNVLKIDYDLPGNPRLSIRRVLDELVQLSPDLFLGQALLHWWWGRWQRVAHFTLRPEVLKDSNKSEWT